jgi:uncharacterized OB-fold protein
MNQHRPEIDDATRDFWAALAEGRLLGSHCGSCEAIANFHRGFCPSCWSEQVQDVELSGRATLYSYSVVHANPVPPFADLVPYVAALVDLDEGPRLATRLVDVDPAEIEIGMALTARFEMVDDEEGVVLFGPPCAGWTSDSNGRTVFS